MGEIILLDQFENRIVRQGPLVRVQKKPFSLLIVSLGLFIVGFLLFQLRLFFQDPVVFIVIKGFSYIVLGSGVLFFAIGLFSFRPQVLNALTFDLEHKTIQSGKKTYLFSAMRPAQTVQFGANFSTLQIVSVDGEDILRIVTLPVSKMDVLEKLKAEFNDILSAEKTIGVISESHAGGEFLTRKQYIVFMLILGFLWVGVTSFAFDGLYVVSRGPEKWGIPFWSLDF